MYIPRVKICCIKSIEEASMAVGYGASAIGLVSEMPSGPGPISVKLKMTDKVLEKRSDHFGEKGEKLWIYPHRKWPSLSITHF